MSLLPIRYADFYDVPRVFAVERERSLYLFDCPFDKRADEYGDKYTIYRLRGATLASTAETAWPDLIKAAERVTECAVSDVHFDATRRAAVDDGYWPAV